MQQKVKTLVTKLKQYIPMLQDTRVIGLVTFLIVALLISWSGVKVIDTNYKLQREIAGLQQQNVIQELQNRNLELQNQFYDTDEYLELEARKNFGLAAPGETVWVVPKSVALNYTIDAATPQVAAETVDTRPMYQQNFDAWIDFLFRRGVSQD